LYPKYCSLFEAELHHELHHEFILKRNLGELKKKNIFKLALIYYKRYKTIEDRSNKVKEL